MIVSTYVRRTADFRNRYEQSIVRLLRVLQFRTAIPCPNRAIEREVSRAA